MKKKIVLLLLSLLFCVCSVFCITACGGPSNEGDNDGNQGGGGTIETEDPDLADGVDLQDLRISEDGVLSWSRLKVASKYRIEISLVDGKHTYEVDKSEGSFDLTELEDGASLGYGKNSTQITVFQWQEEQIEGETIGDDIPVSTNSFLIVNTHAGYSLVYTSYTDAWMTMDGFYSESFQDDAGKEYLLSEYVMESAEDTKFNLSSKINAEEGVFLKYYLSESDRTSGQNEISGFDWYTQTISLGDNDYYIRATNSDGQYKDYTLVVRGVTYRNVSVVRAIREENTDGYTETSFETVDIGSMTVLGGDYLDINALYDKAGNGLFRDADFNLYERGQDYLVPVSSQNFTLYLDDETALRSQAEELAAYTDTYYIQFVPASGAEPDRVVLTYKAEAKQTELRIPGKIIGAKVGFTQFSFPTSPELEKIVFEEGITELPEKLLYRLNGLESVIIPESVVTVGGWIFSSEVLDRLTIYCVRAYADIPSGWAYNWNQTFTSTFTTQYDALRKTVADGISYALDPQTQQATITAVNADFDGVIPQNVVHTLYETKTYTVTGLKKLNASSLTELTIPDNIVFIENGALNGCSALQRLSLPFLGNSADDSVNAFLGQIFGANSAAEQTSYIPSVLREITVRGGSIAAEAFAGCNAVTELRFGKNVQSIVLTAFNGCSALVDVHVDSGNAAYSSSDGLIYNVSQDELLFVPVQKQEIQLSDSLLQLTLKSLFSACLNLTSIQIGASTANIDFTVFENCSALSQVQVSKDNTSYAAQSGIVYDKSFATVLFAPRAVTSVDFAQGVTAIAADAFSSCAAVENIVVPDTVQSIGYGAFAGCTGLNSLTVPFIGERADGTGKTYFASIFGITDGIYYSGNMPKAMEVTVTGGSSVSDRAFINCVSITKITLPDSITEIGEYAFAKCTALASICLSLNTTFLGEYAFSETALTELTLPAAITALSNGLFHECSSLMTVNASSTITEIGDYVFADCTSLQNVFATDDVERVGNGAFSGCSKITSLSLPAAAEIGVSAFSRCSALETVTLSDVLEAIRASVFYKCSSLQTISLPESLTYIGENAFAETGLKNIEIGTSVEYIGKGALRSSFESVTLPFVGEKLDGTGSRSLGWAFSSNLSSVLTLPTTLKTVVILGGEFDEKAFYNLSSEITSLTLPEGITSLMYGALPYNLEYLYLPDSIAALPQFFLNNALNLKFNEYQHGKYLGSKSNPYLVLCKVSLGTNSKFTLHENTKIIEEEVFSGNKYLQEVTLQGSLRTIRAGAFSGCTKLTTVKLSEGVQYIGDSAFSGCVKLSTINLPSSISSVGADAFANTAWFNSKPNGAVIINKVLYKYKGTMPSDSEFTVEDGIEIISASAFEGQTGLKSVFLPSSLDTLGAYSFRKCSNLKTIHFGGTVQQWENIYKGYSWDFGVYLEEIICSDGTITF